LRSRLLSPGMLVHFRRQLMLRLKQFVNRPLDCLGVESAVDELLQASHQLAAEMYKHAGAQQAGAQQQQTGGASAGPAEGGPKDGAVDADFEVVDDEEKK